MQRRDVMAVPFQVGLLKRLGGYSQMKRTPSNPNLPQTNGACNLASRLSISVPNLSPYYHPIIANARNRAMFISTATSTFQCPSCFFFHSDIALASVTAIDDQYHEAGRRQVV